MLIFLKPNYFLFLNWAICTILGNVQKTVIIKETKLRPWKYFIKKQAFLCFHSKRALNIPQKKQNISAGEWYIPQKKNGYVHDSGLGSVATHAPFVHHSFSWQRKSKIIYVRYVIDIDRNMSIFLLDGNKWRSKRQLLGTFMGAQTDCT